MSEYRISLLWQHSQSCILSYVISPISIPRLVEHTKTYICSIMNILPLTETRNDGFLILHTFARVKSDNQYENIFYKISNVYHANSCRHDDEQLLQESSN